MNEQIVKYANGFSIVISNMDAVLNFQHNTPIVENDKIGSKLLDSISITVTHAHLEQIIKALTDTMQRHGQGQTGKSA